MTAPVSRPSGVPAAVARSGWTLAVAWLVTRVIMLHAWTVADTGDVHLTGDPSYYYSSVRDAVGLDGVMPEYPVPVVLLFKFLALAGGSSTAFIVLVAVLMEILSALFAWTLWQRGGKLEAWYWMVFGYLLGALGWFRFDLLPGVLVGWAMLWVCARPRVSGALVAAGAALKLWPALLILPLVQRDRAGRRRLAAFAVTGVVLAALSYGWAGWTRLVSPLTFQSRRGLQVEAVSASIAMYERTYVRPGSFTVWYSEFNAYQVAGPGVGPALRVSTVLMVFGYLLAGALGVLAWRHREQVTPRAFTLSTVAVVTAMLVANKTLSPQYIYWLGPVLAVLLWHGRRAGSEFVRPHLDWALAILGLLVAACTDYVFPNHYDDVSVTADTHHVTLVLVARNALLVVMLLTAAVGAVRELLSPRATASTPPSRFRRPPGIRDWPDAQAPGEM